MLTTDEAFDRLVEACPSYFAARDLDRYVEAFEDADTPDLYVRTSALALHVIDELAAGRGDALAPFFAAVDEVLDVGDEDAVELIAVGLVEALQNVTSHHDVAVAPVEVRDRLGSAAVGVWDDHAQLWEDAARTRHGGPRVERADYDAITDPDLRRYFQAHKRCMDGDVLIGASDIVHYETERLAGSGASAPRRPVAWPVLVFVAVVVVALIIAVLV